MYIYNNKDKVFIDNKGNSYYFYTGASELDWKGMFIQRLLIRGYVPNHETELVEMYLDMVAEEKHWESITKSSFCAKLIMKIRGLKLNKG